ncbi:MAG: DUF4191 family protein [Pseudonocardiaceae bacterium]|nr:DUF4191 family protein [Pseudonocardiaceae bacterium]
MPPKPKASNSKAAKPKDREAAKAAKQAKRAESRQRRKQMFEAFKMQRREDKALLPWMIGTALLITLVVFGLGFLFGLQWMFLPVGLAFGVLAAVLVFGRRVQRNVYAKAEGQPGAAAWALQNLKGRRWKVTPAVAGTTQLDAVHRVLGLPGVVLVAEGTPHRVKPLLAQEKKRVARLVGDTPIYDIVVGNDDGQVPLSKLQRHLAKLPRNVMPKQIDALETRLSVLETKGAATPKGPMPQGAKMRNMQRTVRRR